MTLPSFSPIHLSRRASIVILLMVLGGGVGLKYLGGWYLYRLRHVVTDDARVKGTMVSVGPSVSGRIVKLLVDEGYEVEKGDLLAVINKEDYATMVEETEAALEAAKNELLQAEADLRLQASTHEKEMDRARAALESGIGELRESESRLAFERERSRHLIEEAEASVRAARSRLSEELSALQVIGSDLRRVERLFKDGIVPVERMEEARAAFDRKEARVRAAREELAEVEARREMALSSRKGVEVEERKVETSRARAKEAEEYIKLVEAGQVSIELKENRVKALRSRVKEAEARLNDARIKLGWTDVKSPVSGVVSKRMADVGEVVQRGQPLLVINDLEDVWVETNIMETRIRHVGVGNHVDVEVDAFPGKMFEGRVISVGASTISEFALFAPDDVTRTFTKVTQRIPVRIDVLNADHLLKPGMQVVVGIRKNGKREE